MDNLIKAIHMPTFSVSLYYTGNGYVVKRTNEFGSQYGSIIEDFNLASFMFDLTVQEAEGN